VEQTSLAAEDLRPPESVQRADRDIDVIQRERVQSASSEDQCAVSSSSSSGGDSSSLSESKLSDRSTTECAFRSVDELSDCSPSAVGLRLLQPGTIN